jgi:hypothetical protein
LHGHGSVVVVEVDVFVTRLTLIALDLLGLQFAVLADREVADQQHLPTVGLGLLPADGHVLATLDVLIEFIGRPEVDQYRLTLLGADLGDAVLLFAILTAERRPAGAGDLTLHRLLLLLAELLLVLLTEALLILLLPPSLLVLLLSPALLVLTEALLVLLLPPALLVLAEALLILLLPPALLVLVEALLILLLPPALLVLVEALLVLLLPPALLILLTEALLILLLSPALLVLLGLGEAELLLLLFTLLDLAGEVLREPLLVLLIPKRLLKRPLDLLLIEALLL